MSAPVGFIGLGIMGLGMARNLVRSGRELIVWNRTADKSTAFSAEDGMVGKVTVASTPAEVVEKCALTYSMLSTLQASEAVFPQVLSAVTAGKSIVDCATLTPEHMQAMAQAVTSKGGAFLEAPVSGSKAPAEQGTLIFLTAGDAAVKEATVADMDAMGKATFYFGDGVGQVSFYFLLFVIMCVIVCMCMYVCVYVCACVCVCVCVCLIIMCPLCVSHASHLHSFL